MHYLYKWIFTNLVVGFPLAKLLNAQTIVLESSDCVVLYYFHNFVNKDTIPF